MPQDKPNRFSNPFKQAHRLLSDQRVTIYLIPACALLAYYVGGETALLAVALSAPLLAGIMAVLGDPLTGQDSKARKVHLMGFDMFKRLARTELDLCRADGRKSAVLLLRIDDFAQMADRHGQGAADQVLHQTVARIRSVLRNDDMVAAFGEDGVAICLSPQPALDLEICLQLAGRLASTIEDPYSIDGTSVYASASIGFCQLGRDTASDTAGSAQSGGDPDPVIACAEVALEAARAVAPSAIRAYARDMKVHPPVAAHSAQAVVEALENGEIVPWFQPQISTDTGRITGFECLARWIVPGRGPIAPVDFIAQLEKAGKMGRLLEVVLYHALTAVKAWDQAGLDIAQIGVNFSSDELSDPDLIDKVSWELDRFELSADRLAVEILETVVAQGPDDMITRNIRGLAELGCRIDLDDFGMGHASLASIRRFGVGRIKIDRSFVMKSDRDPDQQRMIRAILTMAERLDIETLAEGVETVGEHALLAQLGCTHVQGFGIGRPMPFDHTMTWIRAHNDKLQAPPQIGRGIG